MSKLLMNGLYSLYTSFVTDYLNKGCVISAGTMSGSYSDAIIHVDLINPKEPTALIRVWMLREYHSIFESRLPNAIKIVVKQYEVDKTNWHTYWSNDGVELESVTAYEIEKDKCYTLSADEALEIVKLRTQRWKQRPCEDEGKTLDRNCIPQSVKDYIMNRIHNIRGCKKATIDCIDKIKFGKYSSGGGKRECHITWEFNRNAGCIVLR